MFFIGYFCQTLAYLSLYYFICLFLLVQHFLSRKTWILRSICFLLQNSVLCVKLKTVGWFGMVVIKVSSIVPEGVLVI